MDRKEPGLHPKQVLKQEEVIEEKESENADEIGVKIEEDKEQNHDMKTASLSPVDRFMAFQEEIANALASDQSSLVTFFGAMDTQTGRADSENMAETKTDNESPSFNTSWGRQSTDDDLEGSQSAKMPRIGPCIDQDEKEQEVKPLRDIEHVESLNSKEKLKPQATAQQIFKFQPENEEVDAFGFIALDQN